MAKYMDSLQKVIDLDPKCVVPSHGVALGGTNILQKTMEHREMREKQILKLFKLGKNINQILDEIYFNIPSKVRKYAAANIQSHLKKLRSEGHL